MKYLLKLYAKYNLEYDDNSAHTIIEIENNFFLNMSIKNVATPKVFAA